jgi:hypothetical protein
MSLLKTWTIKYGDSEQQVKPKDIVDTLVRARGLMMRQRPSDGDVTTFLRDRLVLEVDIMILELLVDQFGGPLYDVIQRPEVKI